MKVIPISNAASLREKADAETQTIQLQLPVAPRANARLRFASDVKSEPTMMPEEALDFLDDIKKQGIEVASVMITGPGDPLAVTGPVVETLRLVRRKYPGIDLSITTLGIHGEQFASLLVENRVRRVTLLVDAVFPAVAEKIYAWIRPATKTVPLPKAVKILMAEQAKAVAAFRQAGCKVNIRTTVYPGYNDGHVEEIARVMSALGAETMIVVPFEPEKEDMPPPPDEVLMRKVRELVSKHIKSAGDPGQSKAPLIIPAYPEARMGSVMMLPKPTKERPNVAAVSSNGMDIDLHLGQSIRALIYGPREDGLACLIESRSLPEPGGGGSRWEILADTLEDCFALLTTSAGESPRKALSRRGITVLITDDSVEGTVDVLYGGGKKGKKGRG